MEETRLKKNPFIHRAYADPATGSVRTDKKARIRYRIEKEAAGDGTEYDIFDIIADLSKRLDYVERGLMLLLNGMRGAGMIPADIESNYGVLISDFMTSIDPANKTYETRADLEDTFALYTKLKNRFNKITQIIKEEKLPLDSPYIPPEG
jgi:hypothetical protein